MSFAGAAERLMNEFTVQDVTDKCNGRMRVDGDRAQCVGPYQHDMGICNGQVFGCETLQAFAGAAEWPANESNAWDIANTTWAFVTVNLSNEKLCARAAEWPTRHGHL